MYYELEKESQNNKLKIHDYALKLLMEKKYKMTHKKCKTIKNEILNIQIQLYAKN